MPDISAELAYSQDHMWVRPDAVTGLARIGITDFAQQSLGDVVAVTLPAPGEKVAAHSSNGSTGSTLRRIGPAWVLVSAKPGRSHLLARNLAAARMTQQSKLEPELHDPVMCLPVPGRHGSGRRLAGSLSPDRTPWSDIGSSSKRGMTCR